MSIIINKMKEILRKGIIRDGDYYERVLVEDQYKESVDRIEELEAKLKLAKAQNLHYADRILACRYNGICHIAPEKNESSN